MMTRSRLSPITLCALAAIAAIATPGCKKNNSAYCDATTPCSVGRVCDMTTRQCGGVSVVGGNGDMGVGNNFSCSQCTGATPICAQQTSCVACTMSATPDATCAMLTPASPLCLTSGSGAGACVACRTNADCTSVGASICDATAHDCRACQADAECASGVCDLVESSVTHGRCVDAGQVVYVDGMTTMPGNGLTAATPLAAILDGIDTASSEARTYVHIAPGTYSEVLSIVGRNAFLVADPGTVIIQPNGSKDGFDVSGDSTLSMRGLVVSAPGIGISCQGAGATSIVNAYATQFYNNGNDGIDSNSCTLTLDGCWIDGNVGVGVRVAGSFTIINSIISHNAEGGFSQSSTGAVMTFANNT
ncbi:MAG TPA: right-handed parallel beta-helix repeat-containing protein, partial [Polyangia bacterium]|nr:right-handed parallel beta-helix repeat-containing protein [Polyangia bacterium]